MFYLPWVPSCPCPPSHQRVLGVLRGPSVPADQVSPADTRISDICACTGRKKKGHNKKTTYTRTHEQCYKGGNSDNRHVYPETSHLLFLIWNSSAVCQSCNQSCHRQTIDIFCASFSTFMWVFPLCFLYKNSLVYVTEVMWQKIL